MANYKPNKGSFQKGNPGGGRKRLPEDIRAISNSTKPQIITAYWKIASLPLDAVTKYKPDNILEAGILRCLAEFAKSGKTDQIRHLWAECHGKPKESLDVNMPGAKRIIIENAGSGTDQTS
jgi:hypothetical protein